MRTVWLAVVSLSFGCASSKPVVVEDRAKPTVEAPKQGATEAAPKMVPVAETGDEQHHVDAENGFTIDRPNTTWNFFEGSELSTETIAVPLVVSNTDQNAQVVVQIAPAVATPFQFAERLVAGLNSRAGFETTNIQPIPLGDGAVGFDFSVEEEVKGRVAILEGTEGRVFVLLATWPKKAPRGIEQDIDSIIGSMKTGQ